MTTVRHLPFILAMALVMLTAVAQATSASELYFLGGVMHSPDRSDDSYSWQLEYRQDLLKHLAAGVSYLNEGHIEGHHRDGYTAQLWARTELLDYRLTVAGGIGPYFFLDTMKSSTPHGFTNDHGLKVMLSLAAAWHLQNDLIFEVRSNWVEGPDSFDTASLLAGIGYHFDPNLESTRKGLDQEPKNEVTVFLGQTIVNSFDSQKSIAAGLEYRRRLLPHLDWTVTGLYEGDNRLYRRDGIITQFWATQLLREGLFTVSAGAGPYFDIDHYDNNVTGSDDDKVALMLTLTGSYRFTPHWSLRAYWNRLVTSNDRDTDIILAGLGYRF